MNAHAELSDLQCRRLDAALVLLLANQVNDPLTLSDCIEAARLASTRENS